MTAVAAILKLICIAEDISEDIYLQKIAVFRKKSYPLGTTKYIKMFDLYLFPIFGLD